MTRDEYDAHVADCSWPAYHDSDKFRRCPLCPWTKDGCYCTVAQKCALHAHPTNPPRSIP